MIKGIDNIISWLEGADFPYWKIYPYNSGKNNYLFTAGDVDNMSMDGSLEKFRKALSLLETGRFTIVAKPKPEAAKSYSETTYEHEKTGTNPTVLPQVAQVSGISENDVQRRIDEAVEKTLTRIRLENLEKENNELRKQVREASKEDPISGIFRRLDPYLDPIMQHVFPQNNTPLPTTQVSVSGFSGNSQSNTTHNKIDMASNSQKFQFVPPSNEEEASQRATTVTQAWAERDEDFLHVVEKIFHTLENDPAKYKMFSQMLLAS